MGREAGTLLNLLRRGGYRRIQPVPGRPPEPSEEWRAFPHHRACSHNGDAELDLNFPDGSDLHLARAQPLRFTLDCIWAERQKMVGQHTENLEMLRIT